MSLSGSVDPDDGSACSASPRLSGDHVARRIHPTALGRSGVRHCGAVRQRRKSHNADLRAQGRLIGAYRKRHLGEGEEGFTPEPRARCSVTGRLRFGIAICAEGRVDYPFDEPASAGAEISLFCAAPGLHGRRTDAESWRPDTSGGSPRGSAMHAGTHRATGSGLRS